MPTKAIHPAILIPALSSAIAAWGSPDDQTIKRMRANRSRDTGPEMKLRRAMWAAGIRGYRTFSELPGKPDIVLSRARVAVFVHGCYWHHCDRCNKILPKRNAAKWREKFLRTKKRDEVVRRAIQMLGWTVVTCWECEINNSLPATIDGMRRVLTRQQAY
jgi:DNA mismatch endonuclease (patch repair protein)